MRAQVFIGPVLNPRRYLGIGRPAVSRIIFEAAIFRWIVGWRNDNAIGQLFAAAPVVSEDGMGDGRGWSEGVVALDHGLDPIPRQDLKCCALSRSG